MDKENSAGDWRMGQEIKCSECRSELETRETWADDGQEYRHLEYFYCPKCKDIRDHSGHPIHLIINERTSRDPLDIF